MPNIFKRMSLMPAGMRYKLMVVFCLMAIIPLLICVYIATNFVFPNTQAIGSVSLVIVITAFIAILGFIVAKQMIEPVIDIALQAKLIAGGDFGRSIEVQQEDEVGDLGTSLNIMTQRIRDNIGELKAYGDKTREINTEIHKKVTALSGLLQVGNLISAGTDLKTILDVLVEKISQLDGDNPGLIMLLDRDKDNLLPVSSINFEYAETSGMPASLHHGLFARMNAEMQDIIVDKRFLKEDKDIGAFKELYQIKHFLLVPILIHGKLEGVMMSGSNNKDVEFSDDDVNLLHVFCKQAAIAIENDQLIKKAEELEVRDSLTGLFNSKYIKERLEEEIKRAVIYQRPCSFILFNIDNFRQFCDKKTRFAGEQALKKIGQLIASELTPVDRAGRYNDDEFALILPERSKKEAGDIAEEMAKKIEQLLILPDAEEQYKHLTVSGGLSENPIDGVSAKELLDKANAKLKEAKAAGKGTIKV